MIQNCNQSVVMSKHSTQLNLCPYHFVMKWIISRFEELTNSFLFLQGFSVVTMLFSFKMTLTSFSPWCSQLIVSTGIWHTWTCTLWRAEYRAIFWSSLIKLGWVLTGPFSFLVLVGGGPLRSLFEPSESQPLASLSVILYLCSASAHVHGCSLMLGTRLHGCGIIRARHTAIWLVVTSLASQTLSVLHCRHWNRSALRNRKGLACKTKILCACFESCHMR